MGCWGWQRLGNGAGRMGCWGVAETREWGRGGGMLGGGDYFLPLHLQSKVESILGQGGQDHSKACVSLNSWISLFVTIAEAVVFGKTGITLSRAAWSRRHGDHGKAVVWPSGNNQIAKGQAGRQAKQWPLTG